jgi:hypothetical protein
MDENTVEGLWKMNLVKEILVLPSWLRSEGNYLEVFLTIEC